MNQITTTPEGCTTLHPWEDCDGEPVRYFRGTAGCVIETATGNVEAYVDGVQTIGGVTRTIVVNDRELTADQARELVAAVGAMLTEVEG